MATHSSILAWEIPWTEEPGGLQSMGSERIGHNLVTKQQQIHLLTATTAFVFLAFTQHKQGTQHLGVKPASQSPHACSPCLFTLWKSVTGMEL